MRERTRLEQAVDSYRNLENTLEENLELLEMAEAEDDASLVEEAEAVLLDLGRQVELRRIESLLSGEADANDSYLEVHAGAGGTDSQDWGEMLLRMYTRWAESHGYKVEWIEESPGEEAGIKSATVKIRQRLWLAQERKRCAPSGAHLALRFQRTAPHCFRQRRRLSGDRRRHQHRDH
jgi:peptide chain release factor 2